MSQPSQPRLGKIELLSIRELWNHEERDFTPWLAQNIDQLSDVLGVPVVVDQIEHKVGSYELDILGHVDENDAIVIVENQLSATDHGDLGQLITYASGLEAAIIVGSYVSKCNSRGNSLEFRGRGREVRSRSGGLSAQLG